MERMKIPMSKKSKTVAFKEDIYVAEVTKLEKRKGDYGLQIQWNFKIMKGKYKGATIFAWTPYEARPKNKLGKWLKKLLPKLKFKDGKYDIMKAIMGKTVRISIVHTEKVNDDGTPKCKVEEVFRYKKKKSRDEDEDDVEEEEEDEEEEEGEEDEDDDEDEDEDDEDEEDEEDEDEEDDEEDEDEDSEEEEEKRSKKKKKGKGKKKKKGKVKKGKGKKKKKKKSKDEDEDDEDEEEDEDFEW